MTYITLGCAHSFMKYIAVLILLTLALVGCDKKDETFANRAGESVGKHLTDFSKGVGKGFDRQMAVQVSLSPEVLALGLTNTVAKALGFEANKKGFSVYMIASQSVSNTMVARALNADGVEIGRSRKPVVLDKGDAGYVTFEFPAETDTEMVRKYAIGL